jgi:putative MATE family efflux protein
MNGNMGLPKTAELETATPAKPIAVFLSGSTLSHVLRVTITGSIGLMAIFIVDFLSLLYVSWLKDDNLTAGVGYASVILFFLTSTNIGFMIATSALAARRLGADDKAGARRIAGTSIGITVIMAGLLCLLLLPFVKPVLGLIGADGEVRDIAARFLNITLPSNILMALGMGYSGALRATGDANRAMYVTLAGGIVTAIVDPILIFGLGLGVDGAAICIVLSRLVFALVGWHGAVKIHDMVAMPRLAEMREDGRTIFAIAAPAILTNVATPFSLAVVARIVSVFGPSAIAANAVIDRLTPLAFGALFALSGAVGPILAQNWGGGQFSRMRSTMTNSFKVAGIYVFVTWMMLVLSRHQITALFQLSGQAAEGVIFFCWISGPMWFFVGLLFTANAAFNNLGRPIYSTAFNWGRATLGTIPFAWFGAQYYGYNGALAGMMLGSILFGILAAIFAMRTITQMEQKQVSKS